MQHSSNSTIRSLPSSLVTSRSLEVPVHRARSMLFTKQEEEAVAAVMEHAKVTETEVTRDELDKAEEEVEDE